MASPGGGRLSSEAWQWFNEQTAQEEVRDLKTYVGKLPAVPEPVKEVYQGLPSVSGSVLCFGCTGYIGEAVVFDAVRRGLKVTLFIRTQTVERFSKVLDELKIKDKVMFHEGDVTSQESVEKAMQDTKAECVVSLLASPQITDEQNIFDIDYKASHTVVQAARKCGVKQFIYCSDTGVYQPSLCCQFHKLRIEGELMRCLPDGMQYTVVRPTTYLPYVVSAIVLDQARHGQDISLFGNEDDAGDMAVYNAIAREDLGRFIVSCVNNQNTYGRVLAVGGPWSADNIATLGDITKWLISMACPAGGKPSKIKPLGMNLSDIIYKFLETLGHFSPTLKKVATIVFFYTKYWSTVSHFSPATGVYDTRGYAKDLVAALKKDPDAFSKFIENAKKSTTGSIVYPTPRNSWWDITQPSVSPDHMPMGAGKASDEPTAMTDQASSSIPDAAEAAQYRMMQLRSMAPSMLFRIGKIPDNVKDEPVIHSRDGADDEDAEWVCVKAKKL
eukprot:TRINITY_DN15517_c0_g1_i1.p1 TRINITY_DN15517_c0_g1~~TRINITY_DN15517_c0_g1_i1.p1  ORF type:complete len:528 (-),score=75.91 TRINITY_DN15517_c0_g1_i1:241-1737(-)